MEVNLNKKKSLKFTSNINKIYFGNSIKIDENNKYYNETIKSKKLLININNKNKQHQNEVKN